MPTFNPRVNVTLSPSLDALVSDLAKLQRVSKASVLRELLEASEPSLRQAVGMMKAGSELSARARTRVADDMQATLKDMEPRLQQVLEMAAGITRDLVAQAEAIEGRRAARRSAAVAAVAGPKPAGRGPGKGTRKRSDPPPSKRGVKR